jgi:ComEC/Rec2-like protein
LKRPIVVAIIGYIIGIIVGLYLQISIAPFCILIIVTDIIYKQFLKSKRKHQKLKLFSIKRYFRYVKIFINSKVILLIVITSLISNTLILIQNQRYEKMYTLLSSKENIKLTGIVISNKEEKQYYNKYKIEAKIQNKNFRFYIMTDKKINLEYGDKIKLNGEYKRPEVQRNYKGFDYSKYLKQLKIYGTIKCSKIEVLDKKQANKMFQISNQMLTKVIDNTKNILDEETSSILLGLVLGYKTDIDETTQENFKNASMAHVLAVSGMHVAYVIFGINIVFKMALGKRNTYILSIFILIFYMFITNFAPSVTRAGIMGILMLFSKIVYRKNDIYTAIAISLFLILIYNPFLILNVGLQLSYGGVLGIIILNKSITKMFENIKIKNKVYKYKIKPKIQKVLDKVKEILSVSISVQLLILPILLENMNTFTTYFLISNLILSVVIGPIVIISFLFVIVILLNANVANVLSYIVKAGIKILILISNIGKMQFSKIYIPTLSLFSIILYYTILAITLYIFRIYSAKNPNITQIRVRNLIAIIKMKARENKQKIRKIFAIVILVIIVINIIPKNLRIYFIDVGQGDSTLIVTPQNKTILIDGGGSKDYDVGKNTLLPYLLDRGFNSIDYIIISHFDNDHVRTDYYM